MITASASPSCTSSPSSRIIGLAIRWPTLRTNISARPLRVSVPPPGASIGAVGREPALDAAAALVEARR